MELSLVDSPFSISEFFSSFGKSLYMLRPNESESIEILPSNEFGIKLSTKVLVAFVDDNFPQFKLLPVNEREEFANFLLFGYYWESTTQIFIHESWLKNDNLCLSLFLSSYHENKKLIIYRNYSQSLIDLNGMSISALNDTGIIDKRSFAVMYPLKIASKRYRYEEVPSNSLSGLNNHKLQLNNCA